MYFISLFIILVRITKNCDDDELNGSHLVSKIVNALDANIKRIQLFRVVGKLSDAPLVHLSCPSRAPLVPLLCPSRAPLVHLSCPSRAPLVHLWRQCPRVPTVSQPCQNEKYRVPFSAHKCTSPAPLVPFSCPSRAPLVHLSCTSRAPLVHLLCTFGATVPVSQSCLKCVKIKNIVTLLQPMKVPL